MNSRRDFLFSMTKYVAFGVVMMKLPAVAKSFDPLSAQMNYGNALWLDGSTDVLLWDSNRGWICRPGVGGPHKRLKSEGIGFNS